MKRIAVLLLGLVCLTGCGFMAFGNGGKEPSTPPTSGILFMTTRHVERDPTSFHQNWEIYRIEPDGTALTRITENEVVDASPTWSPDGRQIAYRSRIDGSADLFIADADGSNPRNLIKDPRDSIFDEFFPRWNPQRDLIAMYTDRFYSPSVGCAWHRIAYMPVAGGKDDIVVLEDHLGDQETLTWSPDGSTIVYSSRCDLAVENAVELFAWNIDTNEVTQLTKNGFFNSTPTYSPNGRFLAYHSARDDTVAGGDVFVLDLETGEEFNLTNHPGSDSQPTWSPDGSQMAFVSDRDGNDEIYVIDIDGTNAVNITNHPAKDWEPAWSPVESGE